MEIFSDPSKGLLSPAVLVDVTGDKVEDIVFAAFNAKVVAINGVTFETIWTYELEKGAETYSPLGVGFFDEDETPDFFAAYQLGGEYPTYSHAKYFVLSGVNGTLISKKHISSFGSEAGIITLSMSGKGNDIFLFWTGNCHGRISEKLTFNYPACKINNNKIYFSFNALLIYF